ncbi:hypothetical protein DL98DRAFT_569933 [Cadophora sp. DSE1049]|nr:hypothetical protein DL98DRAFT_569933 [Cadophora sp. DSE1049]
MSARKRACDTCHARKIHCDGVIPSCDAFCARSNAEPEGGLRKDPGPGRVSELSTGRTYESALAVSDETPLMITSSTTSSSSGSSVPAHALLRTLSHTPSSSPSCPYQDNQRETIAFTPAETQGLVRCESRLFATNSRDWIRSWSESPMLDLFSPTSADPPWQRDLRHPLFTANSTVTALPEKTVTELYLQLFRSTPFRLVFPIVDAVLFQDTIETAYHPEGDSSISIACVFAFLSIMSHMPWGPRSNGVFDGEACAMQADSFMGLSSPGTSLVELQFYIMQCIHKLFSGDLKAATLCHAIACRLLFMLGGQVYPQSPQKFNETPTVSDLERRMEEHLRKLFWLCYTIDKIIALRTREPPCIDDEQCDLKLPPGYANVVYTEKDFDGALPTALTLFPGDLRLSIIKSRTCKLLFNQAQKLSDTELLRAVRELDGDLDDWRASIPLGYRPTLLSRDDGHGFTPDMDSTQKMHIIMIHLEYHHLMATIHGYISRTLSWNGRDNANLVNSGLGVSSSQTLSVEASRASLEYLRVASHALLGTTFWIVVFYPLNAVLTIIGNVLLHPLQPEIKRDMELLESTASLIKQIRNQRSIHIDNSDISRIDSFVSDVIQLGKSTIAAASRELNEVEHARTETICDST